MELSWIIFFGVSIVSFSPIYILLSKLYDLPYPRSRKVTVYHEPDEKKLQLLDCLRRAAITRVNAAVNNIAIEYGNRSDNRNGKFSLFDGNYMVHLREVRKMMQSLLPKETVWAYDDVVKIFCRATPQSMGDIKRSIATLKSRLDSTNKPTDAVTLSPMLLAKPRLLSLRIAQLVRKATRRIRKAPNFHSHA